MAKNGKKLMDSDMHIIEPPDLWERYIDSAFKDRAPKGWPGHENPSVLEVEGTVYPKSADRFLKLPLSESAQRRIMWDNCARLYAID